MSRFIGGDDQFGVESANRHRAGGIGSNRSLDQTHQLLHPAPLGLIDHRLEVPKLLVDLVSCLVVGGGLQVIFQNFTAGGGGWGGGAKNTALFTPYSPQ